MFISQYTILEIFSSRYRHLVVLTKKSVRTNLQANWTRDSITGCIKIVVCCNFYFGDFFNQISRQTFGTPGVEDVLNLIKAGFNSTHLISKSRVVSKKRKFISKSQDTSQQKCMFGLKFANLSLNEFHFSNWVYKSNLDIAFNWNLVSQAKCKYDNVLLRETKHITKLSFLGTHKLEEIRR